MMVPTNTPLHTAQPATTGTLEPADPIWCHVKTEWDHQFVKRANFIPWLRAQLQVDPIDETASSPEPLLNYVKRRLALAQNQQRLRESANNVQASAANHPASAALVQGPSSATSNVNGAYIEHNPSSMLTTHGSFSTGSANLPPSVNPQPCDRISLANPASEIYGHGPSNSSCAANTQVLNQVHAPVSGNTFSSQLGAIADAHMGNSTNIAPSGSPANGFQGNPNDLGSAQQYFPNNASTHQYQQSQMQFLQGQALSNGIQQEHMQPSSLPQQSSVQFSPFSSAYGNHHAQPNPALVYTTTHSHPLQPQNVNQYSHAVPPTKVAPYDQFVETHQKMFEQRENAFAQNNQNMDFNEPSSTGESNNWNPAPVVQIDPALFSGSKSNNNLRDNISPIPPAIDVPPQPITTSSSGSLSPRRTRSAVAMLKKNTPTPTLPNTTAAAKKSNDLVEPNNASDSNATPEKKSSDKATDVVMSSTEDSAHLTATNSNTTHSPSNAAPNRKANSDSSTSRTTAPADQYNRKAWQSRLANIRVELDHVSKTPSRSASKLVKTLSMFSISPTPTSGDWSTVPLDGRIEVMSAIRACATHDFYDTWAHESKGLAMLESWLKGAVHAQEKAKTKETSGDSEAAQRETVLINILQTLSKLSLTVENLQSHAFAKLVLRINKDQNANKFSAEVKHLSTVLEQKWRVMARVAKGSGSDNAASPDTKKRPETAIETNHNKKRKIETTRVPIVPASSLSKNASDLFGRPDKSKLPAFTKKAAEPTPAAPVVQDTFAEAMGLLKGRSASSMSAETTPFASHVSSKNGGKPAKRVRFMADTELCQIRIVERLVYEGEEYETHPVGDARKMDAVEGRYLHSSDNFLEEEIEWETPFEVLFTSETISNLETSPLVSAEAAAQEEREKGLAEVIYSDECPTPDSPHEPIDSEQSNVGDTQSAGLPKIMKLGGDLLLDPEISHLIAKAQADNSMDAPVATDHSVLDLLARLGRGGGGPSESSNQPTLSSNPSSIVNLPPGLDMNFLNSISQGGSLQSLFAAPGNVTMGQPSQPISTTQVTDPYPMGTRDNGWGAAAGSASRNREPRDPATPYIPTGPSAGVSRNKRRKKGKEGNQPRIPAHDSFGRHIKCKWWPNCPHGAKCFYKHG